MNHGRQHIEISMLRERCRRFRPGDINDFRAILDIARQLTKLSGKAWPKHFAAAVGTTPGIVGQWERGRSAPRPQVQRDVVRLIGQGNLFVTEK